MDGAAGATGAAGIMGDPRAAINWAISFWSMSLAEGDAAAGADDSADLSWTFSIILKWSARFVTSGVVVVNRPKLNIGRVIFGCVVPRVVVVVMVVVVVLVVVVALGLLKLSPNAAKSLL